MRNFASLVIALLLTGPVSADCFPGPEPGYWDCLLEDETFFDGTNFVLLDVDNDVLEDSFTLLVDVKPDVFGEPAGEIFSSEHIDLFHNRVTGEFVAVVQTSNGVLFASVPVPLETLPRLRFTLVEVGGGVFLELTVGEQMSTDGSNEAELLDSEGPVYAGARFLPPAGFDSFFNGHIGPMGLAALPWSVRPARGVLEVDTLVIRAAPPFVRRHL